MAYFEGEIPTVVTGNGYGNNGGGYGFGGEWGGLIGLLIVASLFGRGGFGFGGGQGGYGTGEGAFGWQLGRLATQEDVASGFNNSAVLSSLNDLKLGQSTGFAGVQQTLCQGFNGINTAILQGFHGVDNAICTLGYQNQQGFNSLGHQISDCCCKTQGAIADLKYSNERQTCEIINAINAGNQRLVDIYTSDKIDTLNRKLATAEAQLSNNAQSRYIIDTILDKLSPCPRPAYITCNPNTGLTYPVGYTQANFGNNGCCGCGNI